MNIWFHEQIWSHFQLLCVNNTTGLSAALIYLSLADTNIPLSIALFLPECLSVCLKQCVSLQSSPLTMLADTVGGLAIPNDNITIACLVSLVLHLVNNFGLLGRFPEANRGFLNAGGVYHLLAVDR